WKTAAKRLCERHDIRHNAAAFIGEHLARARDARLHLVEHEQQAMLIAQLAQATQKCRRRDTHAAFTLDRFDQNSRSLRTDGALDRIEVAKGHLIETIERRTETVEIFLVPRGRDGRKRAA